jgi:murein DD-endopeptidase MepM/ murein hydrolase activator NlpD
MGKIRYRYNPETCRYEPWKLQGKALQKRVLTFLLLSFTLALCGYFTYVSRFGSLEEILLDQKNQTLKAEWQILEERISKASLKLSELIDKDDHNYRVILDSSPLDPSIREAGTGGSEKLNVSALKDYPVLLTNFTFLQKLKHKLGVEVQSFQELNTMLEERTKMWASRPAIQPINNKELTQLHTTYGMRFNRALGAMRDHKGLDFTAEVGTPIYATGDGKVSMAYYSDSYGNVVYIDHGFDYETRYAHLVRFNVAAGEQVKRGEVIGFVGNTGLSVGPHLHYEVLYKGQHVNPINFFQRDLSNKEYEKLIKAGSDQNGALD